jgi:streptogramin lyase
MAARFTAPWGLASDGIGTVWVADYGTHSIRQVNVATGEVTTVAGANQAGFVDGIGADARFQFPEQLVYDHAGSLYVADIGNYAIRRIWLATHAVSTIVGQPGKLGVTLGPVQTATLGFPYGIACTPSGTVVMTSEQAVLAIVGE